MKNGVSNIALACAMLFFLQGCGGGDDGGKPVTANPKPVPPSGGGADTAPPSGGGADSAPHTLPLTMQLVSPLAGVPGTDVTVAGKGFTRNTRLLWGDVELEAVFQSPEQLTFRLPAMHGSEDIARTLTLRREDGVVATWAQPLTIRAIPEPASLSVTSARIGQLVRVTGANLRLVTRIAIGDKSVTPRAVADDGTWLEFLVPDQAPSGSVVVLDANGQAYAAGTLTVAGPALALKIDDVEIAQAQLHAVSKSTPSPYLRLVPGKPLLVRVRLSPNAGAEAIEPEVRLTVGNDKLGTRTVVMQGPARLSANTVSENDLANSYTYELSGEWVQKGLQFFVEANEKRFPASTTRFSYVPPAGVLGGATYIRMHLVPIAPDSGEKVDLDYEAFKRNVRGLYPLSEVDFVMEPPLEQAGLKLGSTDDSAQWLNAITALRVASQPGNYDFYFGVMPCNGCTGLGWTPGRSAVGAHRWYGREDWAFGGVMLHELGHNFGRRHTWDDANFPYKVNGEYRLGGPWVVNLLNDRVLYDPAAQYDVMSYSYPKTVSDYTYSGAYAYLETNLPLSAKPAGNEIRAESVTGKSAPVGDALYVSGSMNKAHTLARIAPVLRMPVSPDTVPLAPNVSPRARDIVVEIVTGQGRFRYATQPVEVSHGDDSDALAFNMAIPALSDIRSIRVVSGANPLLTRNAIQDGVPKTLMAVQPQQDATVTEWGSYRVRNGSLTMTWDARRWPWLSVWQDGGDGLKPLAIGRTGGNLTLPLRGNARGFVVSLSDGLNSKLVRVDP